MGNAASLNPESFTEGGGLIDDVDVTFEECRFEMFDYQGAMAPPGSPSLKVVMKTEEDEKMDQYYSMGAAKDWLPSEDGTQLVSVGSASGIRASSNGGIFLKSLIDAGFPADKIGSDISVIDGLRCHVIRVPEPARSGLKKTKKQEEREEKYGPKTILVVSEILTLPWEKEKPKGKAKPAGKPAAAKSKAAPAPTPVQEEAEGDGLDSAVNAIMGILAESGTATKKELPGKLFQVLKDDPNRNEAIKMAFDDDFLADEDRPWTFSDGTLVLG